MLEMTADRLVLVDGGVAREFDGTLDDYVRLTLTAVSPGGGAGGSKANRKEDRRAAAEAREQSKRLRTEVKKAEAELARLSGERSSIDRALFDPKGADPAVARFTVGELMKRRSELEAAIVAAEAEWLAASERLEGIAA